MKSSPTNSSATRFVYGTIGTFFVFFLTILTTRASGQVVVIPSSPPYNIQVLPGSNRQINVNITGGAANTINWSVLSSTGGGSATFTTPAASNVATVTAGLPTVLVTIGPVAGNCSIPEPASSMGSYSVTSTASVTVEAQSVDDPTKVGLFLFNICAKTTTVMIAPAYQHAYLGQHRMLQSWVSGDVDETGTWSIVSQPGSGSGILADTGNRDADFVANETGRYTVQYTSHSNPNKIATAIIYVSPNALPGYVSTPDKTEPRECYPDPALTGSDYEVGTGKQYPSLESTPASGSLKPGSIIRVWNTDLTGSSPSTYHEYYQIGATGTSTQPLILCGVPDSHGNLPVIDGSNAIGQPSVSKSGAAAGAGIISTWPGTGTPYGYWQSGSAGPSYVTVTGLHIAHGTPDYTYTPPGGGAPVPYEQFTSCLNIRSGSYIDLGGNHLDTCGLGVFTADNGNNAWTSITQLVTVTGNHVQNAGISGANGEHGFYIQTWYALLQGNLFDDYNPLASGSAIKWRGVEGIFRYNDVGSGGARLFDLVEIQDATPYITFDSYLGLPGDTNCNDSMYCLGDKAGANILAAYQESFQKDFIYGNELWGSSTVQQIHYLADGGPGMQDRNGTLYFFSNTLDAAQVVFDNGSNGDGYYGYFPARVDARNNILWATQGTYLGSQIQMAFATTSTIIMSATTNLMKTGTFSIQSPIIGAAWANNTDEGWSNGCDGSCPWPLSVPLDPHLYGLSSANYLVASTQPYDPITMIPPAGSAAINAGSAFADILGTMPVRWQYSINTNSLIPRVNPQTIGAVDYAAVASAPVFSPSAGDYTTAPTVSIESSTPSSTIYYTTDGSLPTFPPTGSTLVYTGSITISATDTVQAIAIATGYAQSSVAAAAYEIGPLADTPTFSPAGGSYTTVQTVTICDATADATIYYTIDGTTPSTGSTVYTGPITVGANEVVEAIAGAPGDSASGVGQANYVVNLPFMGPVIAQQCNNFTQYGTTIACTLPVVGAGHTLVIGIAGVTPALNGTVTASSGTPIQAVSDNNFLAAWVLPNTTAGSNTITYTVPSNTRLWLSVVEYANTAASPLDGVAQANLSASWQGSGMLETPTFTTSSPSDVLWTLCYGVNNVPTAGTAPIVWAGLPTPTNSTLLVETGNALVAGPYYGECSSTEGEIISLALRSVITVVSPAISWPTPASITFPTALSGSQLNATSLVAGTFSYSLPMGTVLTAGSQTLVATFVPTDTVDYATATAGVTFTVNRATPIVAWTSPAPILYNTPLSAVQLDASSTVAGSFSYSPALGTVLAAGVQTLTTTFTPTDTVDYSAVTATETLTVIPPVPPSFVQQCNVLVYGATASCTLTGVGAGDMLVIGIAGAGTIPGTVITSAGPAMLAVQDGQHLSAYLLPNVSAGRVTVTFNMSGNTRINMTVEEYANVAVAGPVDNAASFVNPAFGKTISTPSFTTTGMDLLWSFCGTAGGSALTIGAGPVVWKQRPTLIGSGLLVLVEDSVLTKAGIYSGGCTGPDGTMEILTLALKPAL
jgi:hypothetical protein